MRKKSVLLAAGLLAACVSLLAAACGSSSERTVSDHIHPESDHEHSPHTHPPDHDHPALPDAETANAAPTPTSDTPVSAQPLPSTDSGCEAFYAEYRENTAKTSSLMPSLELSDWNLRDEGEECLIAFRASFAKACQQTDICSYTALECRAFQESANFQIRNMEGSRFTTKPAGEWICDVQFRVLL